MVRQPAPHGVACPALPCNTALTCMALMNYNTCKLVMYQPGRPPYKQTPSTRRSAVRSPQPAVAWPSRARKHTHRRTRIAHQAQTTCTPNSIVGAKSSVNAAAPPPSPTALEASTTNAAHLCRQLWHLVPIERIVRVCSTDVLHLCWWPAHGQGGMQSGRPGQGCARGVRQPPKVGETAAPATLRGAAPAAAWLLHRGNPLAGTRAERHASRRAARC